MAGFSLPPNNRVFAIVEVMRAVAAFMIAPLFAHFAATVGGNPIAGTGIALWIGFGLAIAGALIAVLLHALGRARPQAPNLKRFIDMEGPPCTHRRCSPASAGTLRVERPPKTPVGRRYPGSRRPDHVVVRGQRTECDGSAPGLSTITSSS